MPRILPCLLCAAVLLGAVASATPAKGPLVDPDESPDPRGLSVTASGLAYVARPARLSEASIRRAVVATRPRAIERAVAEARTRAGALAAMAGVALGDVQAVTERDQVAELGYGEDRYCGPRSRPRCRVPLFGAATVTVTFATAETSAAVAAGRALVAEGTGQGRVAPRDRRSSASIRHALRAARLAAMPAALAEARRDARSIAAGAGLPMGALFSIAEVRRPYEDPALGAFGPGRFCGTVSRPVFRRDPATGRRKVVGRVSQRRCFFSTTATIALRVTYLPG
ncbi:MAG TPA: hypothetical protein VK501_09910 [Baekduia sp.]|uniref:hypothetical protein n=1 Tax=Baekduia sp. TaxID=2600305 RepID=UPI002BDE2737|nr:hypothetical protein [Baekduia sp.]HMJ34222.1 hypothetical protein [Baekduia sp.]